MHVLGYIILVIHFLLLLWSAGGFLEMILPRIPWKPFTNPEFPNWLLIIHWGSVLFASISFLYGYFAQWTKTPQIMAVAYGLMALVCVIETFGYMTSKTKYLAMGAEFLTYTVILLLLFKNKYFIDYFN
ncbi:hypothetical protein JKA74_02155 [Marivirga sp. S37H4]|uniref:Uncharacterized protein n=1 Tax=Marivirga aurantiaca TaxID=2802615 RepID=A0A934WVW9_9BACT|nr:hypothetical protein [Marivirga aurantiaca]MBK6263825.1 hypothetical protein [Marivirga aurantiaca]